MQLDWSLHVINLSPTTDWKKPLHNICKVLHSSVDIAALSVLPHTGPLVRLRQLTRNPSRSILST